MVWNLLQVSDVLDIEFGSALAERVALNAWEPERHMFSRLRRQQPKKERWIAEPRLAVKSFPLQRGYYRFPFSSVPGISQSICAHLLAETPDPANSPLICTVPYFAPVAELWPGPVVYWLTDRIEFYGGVRPRAIHRLDRRMCEAATLVCPNSQRLADYLQAIGGCAPDKIVILPNATRESNVASRPLEEPGELPAEVANLPRPVAGVIGNLAGNLDWVFLRETLRLTPELHWLFVGPTAMSISDPQQREARESVLQHATTRFVGKKPYGELAGYARAFDVAVLPYRLCEPTYSGSSTRFYEHLAACRPMIATRGFEELLHKEPLLTLVNTAEEADVSLRHLLQLGFDDRLQERRWRESRTSTWQVRARCMQRELEKRHPANVPDQDLQGSIAVC